MDSKAYEEMEALPIKARDFIQMNKVDIRECYRVGNLVNDGAYGQVRWCIHKETGTLRALKVIIRKEVEELEEDLIDEIQVLRCVDHPGIVKVFEFFSDRKRFFIISELYRGGDLYEYIKTQKRLEKTDGIVVDEQRAKDIIRQLLIIVRYLHSRKIVHRDIKPENIMFETKEQKSINIKLVDFGLAA